MSKNSLSAAPAAIRGLAFVLAGALAGAAWAATPVPSQTPLISRIATPPPPNVMITIDDSGSMQANYMPEGTAVVGTYKVAMPSIPSMNDVIDIWYGDAQIRTYTLGTNLPKGVSYADPSGSNLFQRQMRSASVNSIFYDPTVLYLPWLTPDGKTRMADAAYTAARWDPLTATVPLATDLSQVTSVSTKWCKDALQADCLTTPASATYDPALYYVLKAGTDPAATTNYTQFDLNNAAVTSYDSYPARVCAATLSGACCTSSTCTRAQEQQNFANWFVYYRTRSLLMKGAMSESLAGVVGTEPSDIKLRVGWGTINSGKTTVDGVDTPVVKVGIRDLESTQLKTVLTGIQGINPFGSTPLRQATTTVGTYYQRDVSDPGSPWRTKPGTVSDGLTPLSCRRAYSLLTTDGYYNDDPRTIGNAGAWDTFLAKLNGDIDSNNGPTYGVAGPQTPVDPLNPLGYSPNQYVAEAPYKDGQPNMLADYAMAQYVVDLQPNLENKVPQSTMTGDLAYWQHLNMMTVGLGVTGTVDPANGPPAQWSADKIDDLWHAAVDTHGQFFSARNSTTLIAGLQTALGNASATSRSEGGAAVSGATLSSNTFVYLPSYSPVTWTGTIKAYPLDAKTGIPAKTATWDAASVLPKAASRNIFTWDGSGSTPFNTGMSATLKNLVAPGVPTATQDNLINYIRGDQTNEGSTKAYRQRGSVLGDFIDSTPLLVKDLVNLGYDNLPGAPGYRDYYLTKAGRQTGLIVEGANDGMLHMFGTADGVETYAYVPKIELPNLATLAAQDYGSTTNFHRDFVDGPQVETDAYIKTKRSATAWANIVVGSFGGGAPGIYAHDVTNFSAMDAQTMLWEVDGGASGDPDLGYVMSKIPVGVVPEGSPLAATGSRWKAFVGNGAYSANGNAVLLVVDMETGHIDAHIQLDSSGSNGLMGVKILTDTDKQAVAVYAGDLQGNLWRIDLTGSGAPSVGFGGKPLFRAFGSDHNPQPIVEAPAIYPRVGGVGAMVLFGTGKLIDATDADSTTPQSFYSVWDPTPAGTNATAASPFAATILSGTVRSQLTEQVISSLGDGTYGVTQNSVDFSTQLGWFMDLAPVSPTQRVIYSPLIVGQFVLVNTMAPGPTPVAQSCDQNPATSAYFLLPAETGASYQTSPVWDVNDDGQFNDGDKRGGEQAAGYTPGSFGGDTNIFGMPAQPDGTATYRNVTPGSSDGGKSFVTPCVTNCSSSVQKRVWQQLMTPPF